MWARRAAVLALSGLLLLIGLGSPALAGTTVSTSGWSFPPSGTNAPSDTTTGGGLVSVNYPSQGTDSTTANMRYACRLSGGSISAATSASPWTRNAAAGTFGFSISATVCPSGSVLWLFDVYALPADGTVRLVLEWQNSAAGSGSSAPVPTGLTAVRSGGDVTVSWDAVASAPSYELRIDGGLVVPLTATSYTHTGAAGSGHSYEVRAASGGSKTWPSAWSAFFAYSAPGTLTLPAAYPSSWPYPLTSAAPYPSSWPTPGAAVGGGSGCGSADSPCAISAPADGLPLDGTQLLVVLLFLGTFLVLALVKFVRSEAVPLFR